MNPLPSPPTSLIGRCLRRLRGKELTKYLQGFAAEVVITARITSPAAAGRTLGNELIGEPLSPTPILNILAMVESGEIPMTRERLKAVVDQDEGAIRFYTLNPWIIDPTGQSAPPTKKGRKPKNLTQSESVATPRPPALTAETPTLQPAPAPPKPKNSKPTKKSVGEKPADQKPRLTAEELRKLSQQEEEHQRLAFQPKKPEPTPSVFRGTPPPSINASEEEREEWRKISKKEKEEHILTELSKGWEISNEWDGLQPVAKYAKWVGPPPA